VDAYVVERFVGYDGCDGVEHVFPVFSPSVDTSIDSLSRIRWWGADRHIVGVSAQVFGFDDLKRDRRRERSRCLLSGLSVDIQ
jgi:hypothetical protein